MTLTRAILVLLLTLVTPVVLAQDNEDFAVLAHTGQMEGTRTDVFIMGDFTEVAPPAGLTVENWRAKATWPTTPSGVPLRRTWTDWRESVASTVPQAIVLHETGYLDSILTAGSKTDKYITGVHFLVGRDGMVYQLAPLDLYYNHSNMAQHSIGIEIANGNDVGGLCTANPVAQATGVTVPWIPCANKVLILPTDAQLQAIYLLVGALRAQYPNIQDAVANRITSNMLMFGSQVKTLGPKLDTVVNGWKGVISHSIIAAGDVHNDGGTEAMYMAYRFEGSSHAHAWCMVQLLLSLPSESSRLPSSLGIPSTTLEGAPSWTMTGNNADEGQCVGL